MTQVYIMDYNPKYGTQTVGAYYDGEITFADIIKDLEVNQMEIRKVEFEKRDSFNTFIITVV